MSLTSGTRLGSYEVTGPLGAGGMGEVYRARDLKLDRDVALKILPELFASDPERLARFEREAKTLATLNHPHIAQIYGIEDSTSVRALVMELVEGETLADMVAGSKDPALRDVRRGGSSDPPIPIDETLALARQIADALHAAHEQGIVHRDLKPANIKVRPDGTIKVLDFGLAKLTLETNEASGVGKAGGVDGAGELAGLTHSPTLTLGATQAGVILGTAAYMSPEQAKGRPADKRSDVWAFGCVLFEMLTGRRAFEGDDVSDTLAAVLKMEPNWSALPADLPFPIKTLIARCLVKDARQRVADISIARFVLDEASSLDPPAASAVGTPSTLKKGGHDVRRVVPMAAAVVLTATVVGIAAWMLRPPLSTPHVGRFAFSLPEGQQFSATGRAVVAISPDGQQLVYVANNRLYIRSLSEFGSRVIPGTETKDGITSPVFSPDGSSVAFYTNTVRGLRKIPISGGAAVTICAMEAPYGLTWDSTGLIAGQGRRGVVRCPVNGGPPEQLVKVDETRENAHGPHLLPGGDSLIYTLAKPTDAADRWDKAQIVVESLSSHTRKTLIEGGSDARYLPTGHLLYALGGDLFASRFDPARQAIVGGHIAVLEGVRRTLNATTGTAHMDVSSTGTLVYVPGPSGMRTSDRAVAKASRSGVVTSLVARTGSYIHVRATRDGARLALDTDDGAEANVWVYETDGKSDISRITFGGRNRFPIWSPDGQTIAFQSDREGDLAIWVQRIDGTGLERLTKPEKDEAHIPESWSSDGAYISFSVRKEGALPTFALWMLSTRDKKAAPFGDVRSVGEPIGSVFSPDGKWIAYHSRPRVDGRLDGAASPQIVINSADSGDVGIFVEPFPATGRKYLAPKVNIDFQAVWSPNGSELFYVPLAASGQLAAVQVIKTGSGIRFGSPQYVPARVTGSRTSGATRAFDILPDGQFVGPISSAEEAQLAAAASTSEIRIVLNWFDELKSKVPVGR